MSVHSVKCRTRCYDSNRPRRYWPGDTDSIESESPIAGNFEGWPPGTKVYRKIRGSKKTAIKETFRVIPGAVPAVNPPTEPAVNPPTEPVVPALRCDLCGKDGWKTPTALASHRYHCEKRVNAKLQAG